MPRLNTKHQVLAGLSTVSLDKTTIDTTSGGARWFGDKFIYQRLRNANQPNEIATIRIVDGSSNTELSSIGANNLFACPSLSGAWLAGVGVRTLTTPSMEFPNSGRGDGSVYNDHLLIIESFTPNAANGVRDLVTSVLYDINSIQAIRAYKDYFIVQSGSTLVAKKYDNTPIPLKYLAANPGIASVVYKGKIHLLYNYGKYLVFHPFDSLNGRVLKDNDGAFNPDVVLGDDGLISATYSLLPLENPNEVITLTEAQIEVFPVIDLTTLNVVDKFGQTGPASPSGTLISDTTQYVFGQNNKPRTKDHLMEQIEISPGIYAYSKFGDANAYEIWSKDSWGVHHLEDASDSAGTIVKRFVRTEWIPKSLKVGYQYAIEIPEHDEIWMNRSDCKQVNAVPSVRKIWIVNHWKQFDCGPDLGIKEVIAVCYDPTGDAHTTGRYMEVNYFAFGVGWIWWQSHKSWVVYASGSPVFSNASLADNKKFYLNSNQNTIPNITGCAILPGPTPPPSNLKKPEVTVESWKPDATVDGWEFKFIDRENPGFGARVWTENGSFYASFTNPVDSGRTGATRPYKKCAAPTPIPPIEPIPPSVISPVRVDGLVFRNAQDQIFPYRGFSSFLLLKKFLDGIDITTYLKEWSALGYNTARVFSQVNWNGSPGPAFFPSSYPNYNSGLISFLNLLSQHGLYCELVAHTFAYDINEMRAHVARLDGIIKNHKNVFLELANEPPVNGIDINALFSGMSFPYPWATGQYDPTAQPNGTYVTAHTSRDNEWPRKAKDLLEYREGGGPQAPSDPKMACPCVADEPMGGWIINIPGRRSNVPDDFYAYAAVSQLMGAGGTYHHESGLNSNPPQGLELECAKAFITGIRMVSPTYQLGNYTRVGLSGCPISEDNSLRTYGMIIGNLATMVRVRPTGPYKVDDNWIVTASDSKQIVITMARK